MEIPDGRRAALGPRMPRREPFYWFEFDIKAGTYEVALFDFLCGGSQSTDERAEDIE